VSLPRPILAVGLAAITVLGAGGCATRQSGAIGNRFLKTGKPKTEYPAVVTPPDAESPAIKETREQERALAKAREQALRAGPPPRQLSPRLEATDPALMQALRTLGGSRTAASHLAVAHEYRRLGILDQAFDHYAMAQRLDRRSAAAYDGSARIWRDVNRLDRALADASRAVFYAPQSPEIMNTLGTILLAAGNPGEARKVFSKALALNPDATYARHNIRVTETALASATSAGEDKR
jgi:tetratricopeptide (TPR) repeat protein